jgi:hypothetical protein
MYRNTDINSKGVKTMKSVKIAAAAMALAMPGMAMAATDGSLGATSNGSFNATITIQPDTSNFVQITGLDDHIIPPIPLNTVNTTLSVDQICIIDNTPGPNGSVQITVTQSGVSGPFSMTDANSGRAISPTLSLFNFGTGGTLSNGVAMATFGTSACPVIPENQTLSIEIPAPNSDATKVGNFSGTFNVLLAAN